MSLFHKTLGKLVGTRFAKLANMTNRRSEAPTLRNMPTHGRRSQVPTLPAMKAYSARGFHYISYTDGGDVLVLAAGPYQTYGEALGCLDAVKAEVCQEVKDAKKFDIFCSQTNLGNGLHV